MLPMITSFKYTMTFSTQTGKTTLTQTVCSVADGFEMYQKLNHAAASSCCQNDLMGTL